MMVFAWDLLPFSKLFASVAVLVVPGLLVALGAWKLYAWSARTYGAYRVLKQSNAHNRLYLFERLARLEFVPDNEFGYGNDGYVVYHPADEHTSLVIHPFETEVFGIRYIISFHSRRFIGPANIGNRYLYTTEEYTVTQHTREVEYTLITYEDPYDEGGVAPDEKKEPKLLDGLPDHVIARVEQALISWQPAAVES